MLLRAARARRIATATMFSSGGLTLLGASTVGLLYLQAKLARRVVGVTRWSAPPVDGDYGDGDTPPVSFVMMGDSTAAGFAVVDGQQTPGSLLASSIAAAADRPVRMRNVAVVGATSQDLPAQLTAVREQPADLAVILIGANDVINRLRPAEAVRHLTEVVDELTSAGTAVVVGTCPDLGTVRPIGWPLRHVARRASRQLAAAQTIAVVEAGGRTVSLSDLLTDVFWDNPQQMFGPDQFHPSEHGYTHLAAALLPSACLALGFLPQDLLPSGTDGVLPVDRAAVSAAENAGTEVSGSSLAGRERGPRGRWATLVRRDSGDTEPAMSEGGDPTQPHPEAH